MTRFAKIVCRKSFLAAAAVLAFCSFALPLSVGAQQGRDSGKPPVVKGTSVVLLGTAAGPIIKRYRSQPASLLIVNGARYLIDCGEGTLSQLAHLDLQAADINRVFLTHMHFDHTADLGSLLAFNWISPKAQPVQVYGPPGTQKYVEASVEAFKVARDLFREFVPDRMDDDKIASAIARPISGPTVIYQDTNVKVTAIANSHYDAIKPSFKSYGAPQSYSYRFETTDRVIVFSGDTGPSQALVELAKGADILVAETIDPVVIAAVAESSAGYSKERREGVITHYTRQHLVPEEVGKLAAEAKVGMVVLNHLAFSQDKEGGAHNFLAGVRSTYSGPVIVGHDFDQF